jgi:hypothetical protein
MNHDGITRIKITQDVFTSAASGSHSCPRESVNNCFFSYATHRAFTPYFNIKNLSANNT